MAGGTGDRILSSQNVLVGSDSGEDNTGFVANVSGTVVHGDGEGPLVGTRELFVSEAWMRRISNQSFKLLPEL